MKKVLFISYYFPPSLSIGSQRPYKLSKYFSEFGWEPIVLTVKRPGKPPEGIRIIETNYKDILGNFKKVAGFSAEKGLHEQLGIETPKNFDYSKWKSKVIKLIKEIIGFPDPQRSWYKFAIKSASELLSKEKVDVIISTSSPVTSHLIARKLKQKYKIPWIADFRDLWTQNTYINKNLLIRFFEKRLELKTIKYADALVSVTEPLTDLLKKLHKNKKIFCITNGFDPDDFSNNQIKITSKLSITYTGILYNGKRDPLPLFDAIDRLIKENCINRNLIEIRFYGPENNWLIDEIKRYKLEDITHLYGYLSRDEVLKRQKESQLLLLLLWNNKLEDGFCPAKLYEYFGSKRPIIAYGSHRSVVKELIEKTNAGKFAENTKILKSIILSFYNEFIEFGEVKYIGNRAIENYTYYVIAKKYSEVLNKII